MLQEAKSLATISAMKIKGLDNLWQEWQEFWEIH